MEEQAAFAQLQGVDIGEDGVNHPCRNRKVCRRAQGATPSLAEICPTTNDTECYDYDTDAFN